MMLWDMWRPTVTRLCNLHLPVNHTVWDNDGMMGCQLSSITDQHVHICVRSQENNEHNYIQVPII